MFIESWVMFVVFKWGNITWYGWCSEWVFSSHAAQFLENYIAFMLLRRGILGYMAIA